MTFQYAGTLSHGTTRDVDLIVPFMDVLQVLDPAAHTLLADDARRYMNCLDGTYDKDPAYDAAEIQESIDNYQDWFMVDLFDALDKAAPEGYRFGAIEGDASDYGFWEVESDDDDIVTDPHGHQDGCPECVADRQEHVTPAEHIAVMHDDDPSEWEV